MNKDRKLWEKILGLKGLASIGFADTIGSGITAIFWFFIASQLSSSSYGEIHYYLGIAGIAQIISLIGNSNVLSVYAAKNVKIISTLFFISLIFNLFFTLDITSYLFLTSHFSRITKINE